MALLQLGSLSPWRRGHAPEVIDTVHTGLEGFEATDDDLGSTTASGHSCGIDGTPRTSSKSFGATKDRGLQKPETALLHRMRERGAPSLAQLASTSFAQPAAVDNPKLASPKLASPKLATVGRQSRQLVGSKEVSGMDDAVTPTIRIGAGRGAATPTSRMGAGYGAPTSPRTPTARPTTTQTPTLRSSSKPVAASKGLNVQPLQRNTSAATVNKAAVPTARPSRLSSNPNLATPNNAAVAAARPQVESARRLPVPASARSSSNVTPAASANLSAATSNSAAVAVTRPAPESARRATSANPSAGIPNNAAVVAARPRVESARRLSSNPSVATPNNAAVAVTRPAPDSPRRATSTNPSAATPNNAAVAAARPQAESARRIPVPTSARTSMQRGRSEGNVERPQAAASAIRASGIVEQERQASASQPLNLNRSPSNRSPSAAVMVASVAAMACSDTLQSSSRSVRVVTTDTPPQVTRTRSAEIAPHVERCKSGQLRDEVAALQASPCCLSSCSACQGRAEAGTNSWTVSQTAGALRKSKPTSPQVQVQVQASQWQAPKPFGFAEPPKPRGCGSKDRLTRSASTPGTKDRDRLMKSAPCLGKADQDTIPSWGLQGDLESYALGKLIGRGAFGKVNVGVHRATSHQVALKMCDTKGGAHCKRLQTEVEVLVRLKGHPSVVRLHETIETSAQVIFVLELCTGGDLLRLVKRRRALAEGCARVLFAQLMSAVAHMHSVSVAHRDLKLENLLLCSNGRLKVADFGVATVVEPLDKKLRDSCGTPSYMSPEVLAEQGYLAWPADVWSSGIVLYAMLCGAVPFKSDSAEELKLRANQGLNPSTLPGHLSSSVVDLLVRHLEVDAANRIAVSETLQHAWVEEADQ